MEFSFSKVGSLCLAVLSFVTITDGTIIGNFLRWLPFGWGVLVPVLDFLIHYYAFLGSVAFAFIFLQWTRNFYIIFTLALLFFLFVKFGLQEIGAVGNFIWIYISSKRFSLPFRAENRI